MASTKKESQAANMSETDEGTDFFDEGLVLDLTDIEQGEAPPPLRPGTYTAEVEECEFQESAKGRPMIRWVFRTTEEPRRRLYYNNVIDHPVGKARLKDAIQAVDPDFDLKTFSPVDSGVEFEGKLCRVKVKTKMYEGKRRNEVRDVLPAAADDAFLS